MERLGPGLPKSSTNRRTLHEVERQYLIWQTDAEATKVAPLRRQQQQHQRGRGNIPTDTFLLSN
jgi:hypothetical protein